MPQIYIEYSDNIRLIDFKEMLRSINVSVAKIVDVPPDRCKGRLVKYVEYAIGEGGNKDDAFIFIRVAIQAKRSDIQKQQIGDIILSLLTEYALPKLKEQRLKCSPRIEVRELGLYLFSDWTS